MATFTARDYLDGASEAHRAAQAAWRAQCFVACIYWSGVVVECLCRAYWPNGLPFEGRHDTRTLLGNSRLKDSFVGERRQRVSALASEVLGPWRNDIRYMSEAKLERELKGRKLYRAMRVPKGGTLTRTVAHTMLRTMLELHTIIRER